MYLFMVVLQVYLFPQNSILAQEDIHLCCFQTFFSFLSAFMLFAHASKTKFGVMAFHFHMLVTCCFLRKLITPYL